MPSWYLQRFKHSITSKWFWDWYVLECFTDNLNNSWDCEAIEWIIQIIRETFQHIPIEKSFTSIANAIVGIHPWNQKIKIKSKDNISLAFQTWDIYLLAQKRNRFLVLVLNRPFLRTLAQFSSVNFWFTLTK